MLGSVFVLASISAVAAPAGAAPPDRVGVCHRDAGGDGYRLIVVSSRAVAAHQAHGDGFPGGSVPGSAETFDEGCGTVAPEPVPDFAKVACIETVNGGYFYATDGTNPQYLPRPMPFYSEPSCTTVRATLNSAYALIWAASTEEARALCTAAGGAGVVSPQRDPNLWNCN
jgi:hypothetical protein